MMLMFLVTLGVLIVAIVLMAVGVLFGREPLKGTCGGLNRFGEKDCPVCGGDLNKCESRPAAATSDPDQVARLTTDAGRIRE